MAIKNISDLEAQLKKIGYSSFKRQSSMRLAVYMDADGRVPALKDIAAMFSGRYTNAKNGTGWRSSVGAALLPGGYVVLAKPQTEGVVGNIASLDARDFSGRGTKNTFDFHGQQVAVVTFTDYREIEKSVVEGCNSNSMLGEAYSTAFQALFDRGVIEWAPDAPRPVLNKLGVYVGEVLIGWAFLKGITNRAFASNPFRGQAKAFHMPTDPAFSGVDSFIEMTDGSFYAISSKFGAGAKASFFTNLFEKGIDKRTTLSNSYFKKMCDYANQNKIPFKKSKEFVYGFGVREILGLDRSDIATPTDVFNQIKNNRAGEETNKVVAKITSMSDNARIIDGLPNSVSAFFNRTIADELNNDSKSIDQMKEILAGKDYWQANLDIRAWTGGSVKFRFIQSGEAQLDIIGSKSSITDITSKQGWINYELKY